MTPPFTPSQHHSFQLTQLFAGIITIVFRSAPAALLLLAMPHPASAAASASSAAMSTLLQNVFATCGLHYAPLQTLYRSATASTATVTSNATGSGSGGSGCAVCLTPPVGPELLWTASTAHLHVGTIPSASASAAATLGFDAPRDLDFLPPTTSMPFGCFASALTSMCVGCPSPGAAQPADCAFDPSAMLRFNDRSNPAYWLARQILPWKASVLSAASFFAGGVDQLVEASSLLAALGSRQTPQSSDGTFTASFTVAAARAADAQERLLRPGATALANLISVSANASVSHSDCAAASAATPPFVAQLTTSSTAVDWASAVLSPSPSIAVQQLRAWVSAAGNDATAAASSVVTDAANCVTSGGECKPSSAAKLLIYHRRFTCTAAVFAAARALAAILATGAATTDFRASSLAGPALVPLLASVVANASAATSWVASAIPASLWPSATAAFSAVPAPAARYVTCMQACHDAATATTVTNATRPPLLLLASDPARCLFSSLPPSVVGLMSELRVAAGGTSPSAAQQGTTTARLAAATGTVARLNFSVFASGLSLLPTAVTAAQQQQLLRQGKGAFANVTVFPVALEAAVSSVAVAAIADLLNPPPASAASLLSLAEGGAYFTNWTAAAALPSALTDPIAQPLLAPFFAPDGLNCPAGTYRTRDSSSGLFTCTQCRNEAPLYPFCPGDNMQHLCYTAPPDSGVAVYVPQGTGWASPVCPFVCADRGQYRRAVGGNVSIGPAAVPASVCDVAPVGFAPLDGGASLMTCVTPLTSAMQSALPGGPAAFAFTTGGARGDNTTCSGALRFRVAGAVTGARIIAALCYPSASLRQPRPGAHFTASFFGLRATTTATDAFGLVSLLPAPSATVSLQAALGANWGAHLLLVRAGTGTSSFRIVAAFMNTSGTVQSTAAFIIAPAAYYTVTVSFNWYAMTATFFVNGARVGDVVPVDGGSVLTGSFCSPPPAAVVIAGGFVGTLRSSSSVLNGVVVAVLPVSSLEHVAFAGSPLADLSVAGSAWPQLLAATDATAAQRVLDANAVDSQRAGVPQTNGDGETVCAWGYYGVSIGSCALCPNTFVGSSVPRRTIDHCNCLPNFVKAPGDVACVSGLDPPPAPFALGSAAINLTSTQQAALVNAFAATATTNVYWAALANYSAAASVLAVPASGGSTVVARHCVNVTGTAADVAIAALAPTCVTSPGALVTAADLAAFATIALTVRVETAAATQQCVSWLLPAANTIQWPLPAACSVSSVAFGSWRRSRNATGPTTWIMVLPVATQIDAAANLYPPQALAAAGALTVASDNVTVVGDVAVTGYPLHPAIGFVTSSPSMLVAAKGAFVDAVRGAVDRAQLECLVTPYATVTAATADAVATGAAADTIFATPTVIAGSAPVQPRSIARGNASALLRLAVLSSPWSAAGTVGNVSAISVVCRAIAPGWLLGSSRMPGAPLILSLVNAATPTTPAPSKAPSGTATPPSSSPASTTDAPRSNHSDTASLSTSSDAERFFSNPITITISVLIFVALVAAGLLTCVAIVRRRRAAPRNADDEAEEMSGVGDGKGPDFAPEIASAPGDWAHEKRLRSLSPQQLTYHHHSLSQHRSTTPSASMGRAVVVADAAPPSGYHHPSSPRSRQAIRHTSSGAVTSQRYMTQQFTSGDHHTRTHESGPSPTRAHADARRQFQRDEYTSPQSIDITILDSTNDSGGEARSAGRRRHEATPPVSPSVSHRARDATPAAAVAVSPRRHGGSAAAAPNNRSSSPVSERSATSPAAGRRAVDARAQQHPPASAYSHAPMASPRHRSEPDARGMPRYADRSQSLVDDSLTRHQAAAVSQQQRWGQQQPTSGPIGGSDTDLSWHGGGESVAAASRYVLPSHTPHTDPYRASSASRMTPTRGSPSRRRRHQQDYDE